MNEQNDDHLSALHLAVMYNKTNIIFDLLKNGAYIGVLDKVLTPIAPLLNALNVIEMNIPIENF